MQDESIQQNHFDHYGNRVRVRACGVLWNEGKVLMIKHLGLGKLGYLWGVPGGGVELGEKIADCLIREFQEEAHVTIAVGEFLAVHEAIHLPLHAVELFYQVKLLQGEAFLGHDPETTVQSMVALAWFTPEEVMELPAEACHPLVRNRAFLSQSNNS